MQAIVVAPDPDERDLLVYTLRKAGLAVAASGEYKRVLSNWPAHAADALVLALGEDDDALLVVQAVRNASQVPLVLVSEPMPESSARKLLYAGCDLILNRPVSPLLVAAQVSAVLRRSNSIPVFVLPTLDLGRIALDPSARTVQVDAGDPKRLTQLEFRLLYVLMNHRGQVLPGEVIVERVWGYTGEGNKDLVRGLVSRLRHKIEPDPENPVFLETLSGVGYRFNAEEAKPTSPQE